MAENFNNNSKYQREIESELSIDKITLNKNNLLKNQNINFSSSNSNNNNINNNNNDFKSNNNQINILLNSIQEFFNRYELDERKIFSKKKFIISFPELISLITESILAQQKLDYLIYTNDNHNKNIFNLQKINQQYMNDLSYNIFSFDRIDIDYMFNIKKKKKIKSNISPYNIKFKNNSKIKKSNNNSQYFISPNNIKNEINTIFENIYKEVFINDSTSGNSSNKRRNIKTSKKNNLSKLHNFRNNSVILNQKDDSSLNNSDKSKIKNGEKNKNRKNTIINNNINNNISYNNNNLNINNRYNSKDQKTFNSFNSQKKNKGDIKKSITYKNLKQNKKSKDPYYSDIFQACENVNIIKKSFNNRPLSRSSNFYQNDFIDNDSFLKKSLNTVGYRDMNNSTDIPGYEGYKIKGIKRIIVSNVHKPSNLANKLLLSGQKCIDEYKEINKSSKKKKI